MLNRYFWVTVPSDYFRKDIGRREDLPFFFWGGLHLMFGGKLDVGAMISGEATHCLDSALDGKQIPFGIGILIKRICYYPLLFLNRYFVTNDYYSPISTCFLVLTLTRLPNDECVTKSFWDKQFFSKLLKRVNETNSFSQSYSKSYNRGFLEA